jgi:DNA recombination protein RmuC
LDGVGKAIEKAADAHSNAMNKLSIGKGNLVNRANHLKDLGVKTSKNLPPSLNNIDEEWMESSF